MTKPHTIRWASLEVLLGLLFVVCVLQARCRGQIPMALPQPAGTINVLNLTQWSRSDVVTSVLPFARGRFRGGPLMTEDGAAAQVDRLGAAWPDGSWRHARVSFPVRLSPREFQPVRLVSGGVGARPGFSWTEAVRAGASSLAFALQVGNSTARFGGWVAVEDGHLVKAWRARARAGVVWAEVTLELGSGQDHAHWWLWYGDSSTEDPDVVHDLGAVTLVVGGGLPVVRHSSAKVLGGSSQPGGLTALQLMTAQQWGDGESQAMAGALLFRGGDQMTAAAETQLPVLACSPDWPSSGAFGPWGVAPDLPAGWDLAASYARAVGEWRKFGRADPWETPAHGLARHAPQTGAQGDFGCTKLTEEAHGWPSRLHGVQRSVYQEACRPVWLRNPDASPLRLVDQVPFPHVWAGRVFHRTTPNKLGKDSAPGSVHGFTPRDRQHWSSNVWALFGLLTADRLALDMLEGHTDLWLASNTTNSGNPVIDGLSSPRGVGRTLHAGVLCYLATGRQDVADLIRERCDHTAQLWVGRTTSPTRPLGIMRPDARKFQLLPIEERLKLESWIGWEHGLGLRGIDAASQVFRIQSANDLVYLSGSSLLSFGVWKQPAPAGNWVVADAVAWHGGRELTPVEVSVGQREAAGRGGQGFVDWTFPAIVATRRHALIRGDTSMAALADPIIAQTRAAPWSWERAEWMAIR